MGKKTHMVLSELGSRPDAEYGDASLASKHAYESQPHTDVKHPVVYADFWRSAPFADGAE
jgi:hypothetical protein